MTQQQVHTRVLARTAPNSVITASHLTKQYLQGRRASRVLCDVSVSIRPGELTAVTGPSGSGKTTLLRILGGLSRPDRGTVRLHGEDLYALSDARLSSTRNQRIGFVFQDYRLLPTYNAVENVMMPLAVAGLARRHQRRHAESALRRVGLGSLARQRVDRLSGGQQQRVGIARALAMRPSVLLADEPTGNLDRAAGAEIVALFGRLRAEQGLSIVLVTHDEQLAGSGDHIVRIVDGCVQEDVRAHP